MLNMMYQSDCQRTASEQQKARRDRRTNQPVVVIVDHDQTVLELMKELLQAEGYTIHGFMDHDVRNATIQQICPDLVILEAHPRNAHTPAEMIHELRHITGLCATPIMINSTDKRLLESVATPLNNHCCYTFEKPFDIDYFLQFVQSIIESARKDNRANTPICKN